MTIGSTSTKRRTFFQRGIALLAGGAAVAGTTRWASAASPPSTLTLYASPRPVAGHQHGGDRIVAAGDVFDRPGGERIGTFYTNCFCLPSPFGLQVSAASNLEFHVLQLNDGTLFGIGSGVEAGDGRRLAIVGGTDRYAGRSGSYVQRSIAGQTGDDVRELVVTFAG
jgi:hypothetical protein